MAETYSAGVVTAYGAAVRGGYTGTYEEFCAEQAEFAENAAAVAQAKEDVETMQGQVEQAAATFTDTTVPAAVTTVQEAGAAQVQAVQSEGTMQAEAVETVGAQQTAAVGAAGSDAVDAVEAAETAATDAVTAAQTAAVQAVQTESTTQQAAIQTKGQETIASIPEDYTALSGEVDDLKSALEPLDETFSELDCVKSPNLFDYSAITKGKIVGTNGVETENGSYNISDFIPVTVGEKITMFPIYRNENHGAGIKDIAVYDANKTFIYRFSDLGGNAAVTHNADASITYTIGNRVAYLRVNFGVNAKETELMVNNGELLMPFAPYGFVSRNVFNYKTATYGKIINTSGELVDSNYFASDFIYVGQGNSLTVMKTTGGSTPKGAKDIALYDASKNFLYRVSDIKANNPDGSYTIVAGNNVEYMRINFAITTDEETTMVNLGNKMLPFVPFGAYSLEHRLESLAENENEVQKRPPIVFDQDYDLHNFSDVIGAMDWAQGIMQPDILEQVYALFDGLVEAYPDYVSKEDAAVLLGLSYPAYANGTVDGVPQYKVYMYKLIFSDDGIGTAKHKRKSLIVSGVHGNELAAPVNTYLFAKQLCEANDPNYFKLRAAFDFYIIPCLNGFGMYKITRGNGNKVNINRNFPIRKWAERYANTMDSQWANEYTGPSAGSEFETKIVMGMTDSIMPDLCIDHHNYGSNLTKQFYVEAESESILPVIYQELADCMIAFKKGLPQYFGTAFQMLTSGQAPKETASDMNGTTSRYWYENGIENATTLEISQSINYVGGAFNGGQDLFGADTFAVAEYNFRNHILKLGQYVLGN